MSVELAAVLATWAGVGGWILTMVVLPMRTRNVLTNVETPAILRVSTNREDHAS